MQNLTALGQEVISIQSKRQDIKALEKSIDDNHTEINGIIDDFVDSLGVMSSPEGKCLLRVLLEIQVDMDTKTPEHALRAIKSRINSVIAGIEWDRDHAEDNS